MGLIGVMVILNRKQRRFKLQRDIFLKHPLPDQKQQPWRNGNSHNKSPLLLMLLAIKSLGN